MTRRSVSSIASRLSQHPVPGLGRHQLLLRLLIALMPPAALLISHATPTAAPTWLIAAVLALATGWALFPESAVGAVALIAVLCWWGYALPTAGTPWCTTASAMLYLAHSAASIAALGPSQLDIDRAVLRLWAGRLVVASVTIPVAYLCVSTARASHVTTTPVLWALAVIAAALAALLAASSLASHRCGPQDTDSTL